VAVPLAIAHRGDPVTERENTLGAFRAAVRAGADMVELDLRIARDGEIMVLHDATLSRLWGIDEACADLDLAALQAVGEGDVRIPTLRQVLRAIDIPLMVDFTGPEVVEGALRVVRDEDAADRSLFVTGHVPALRSLRALAPEARIGLTWVDPAPPPPSLLAELDAEYWNPVFRLVTPEQIAAVHALGRQVSTWTVDDPSDMATVMNAGVDAIVSNRIAELRHVLVTAGAQNPTVDQ
jgi:glycerophosphoryl diester phosphodiesterase